MASARIVNNTGVSGAGSTTARSHSEHGIAVSGHRPGFADACAGDRSGISRQHFHVRRATGIDQRRAHRHEHRLRHQHHSRHGLRSPRNRLAQCRAVFLQAGRQHSRATKMSLELHRYTAGGTLGGPLIKDKLFGFVSYQHIHASDLEIGTSRTAVPSGLTDDRSAAALANVDNAEFSISQWIPCGTAQNTTPCLTAAGVDPTALQLLNTNLPNGQYLFPSANPNFTPTPELSGECFPHPAGIFHLRSGRRRSRLPANLQRHSVVEVLLPARSHASRLSGIPRSKASPNIWTRAARSPPSRTRNPSRRTSASPKCSASFAKRSTARLASPSLLDRSGINNFGSNVFPGITIVDDLGNASPLNTNFVFNAGTTIGSTAASQGAFTGIFQNRWMPSANADLEPRQTHDHLRRKLLLHPAQRAR